MDYSNIITPDRLTNMQEMEVNVDGPDGANRLFIYSGMAEVELCGGLPHPRWSQATTSIRPPASLSCA